MALWSRPFEWKNAIMVVKLGTLLGWPRKSFKLFCPAVPYCTTTYIRGKAPRVIARPVLGGLHHIQTIRPQSSFASPTEP